MNRIKDKVEEEVNQIEESLGRIKYLPMILLLLDINRNNRTKPMEGKYFNQFRGILPTINYEELTYLYLRACRKRLKEDTEKDLCNQYRVTPGETKFGSTFKELLEGESLVNKKEQVLNLQISPSNKGNYPYNYYDEYNMRFVVGNMLPDFMILDGKFDHFNDKTGQIESYWALAIEIDGNCHIDKIEKDHARDDLIELDLLKYLKNRIRNN